MNQNRKIEDEIKFKELPKTPLRLFGWVYPYFFILILAFGIFFGHQIITISFNEMSIGIIDSTNVKKEIVEKKGGITPAVDMNTIKSPSREMIAKGKELYDANCQSCHGANGTGDGPAGAMLNPKPRNFHQAEGWTNGRTIVEMYKTLQEGIINNGMAAYEYLPPSDLIDIIHYIRTLASYPEIMDGEINSLNSTYKLSVGTITANMIPVDKAGQKLEEENTAFLSAVEVIKEKINRSEQTPGLKLLRSTTYNINMVLKSFITLDSNQSFEKFYSSVNNSPIMLGYKPSVLQLNNEQWRILYDYLKSVVV